MGRKCDSCFNSRLGYCPFDFACEYEVWDAFARSNIRRNVLEKEKRKETGTISFSHSAMGGGREVKANGYD